MLKQSETALTENLGVKSNLWKYLSAYVKARLLEILSGGLHYGQLTITEGSHKYCFGHDIKVENGRRAELHVKREDFWVRVYLWSDLGFAEAYMNGDFDTPSLKDILHLWLDNPHLMEGLSTPPYKVFSTLSALYIRFLGHTFSQAVSSVVTGYDCSNEFFKIFLSDDMTYSCALWPDRLGGVRGDMEGKDSEKALKEAQLHKLHNILQMAKVKPGDRVLEFGSGWGSMAIEAAKMGCTVDTLTLSVEQKYLAEERIGSEGLQNKITVHLLDYRKLPEEFKGAFDAFVSVEMVEAVGIDNLPLYFKIVDWALKPDKGAAVIQATTQPESRYTVYQHTDYARRYQWPNSFLPSATSFVSVATSSTEGRLGLECAVDYGTHYPRTLRDWGRRLQANWNEDIVEKLQLKHPELASKEAIEAFKRKWEYMYVYAEVGYARAYTCMHLFTFVRPNNVRSRCD